MKRSLEGLRFVRCGPNAPGMDCPTEVLPGCEVNQYR